MSTHRAATITIIDAEGCADADAMHAHGCSCDGVIVETEELHRRAYNAAFQDFGLNVDGVPVDWDVKYYVGHAHGGRCMHLHTWTACKVLHACMRTACASQAPRLHWQPPSAASTCNAMAGSILACTALTLQDAGDAVTKRIACTAGHPPKHGGRWQAQDEVVGALHCIALPQCGMEAGRQAQACMQRIWHPGHNLRVVVCDHHQWHGPLHLRAHGWRVILTLVSRRMGRAPLSTHTSHMQ